ncbi:hypothetical protein Bbelb_095400 [Branchiostoma belcheri]|nr:hypothetical protein Bbelb_095400 [Branchiostoma belcheri]
MFAKPQPHKKNSDPPFDPFNVPVRGIHDTTWVTWEGKVWPTTHPVTHVPAEQNCAAHHEFLTAQIEARLEDGSIKVWGKVGQCKPPHLVLPLTVEPSKPRMCWDGRFLNLWTKDCPFTLDPITEAPRMLKKGGYMTHTDEKSGYSHISLSEDSWTYFGFEFSGYFFVYCSLPFGWKGSAYVYNTTGTLVSSYARHLGVPTMLYIDDRLNGEASVPPNPQTQAPDPYTQAQIASYIMCDLLTRAGYFFSLEKCIIVPVQRLVHLGTGMDTKEATFFFPEDKKGKFASLRESILSDISVTINDLQKFVGKCVSMALVVPGARIYTRQCNKLISDMTKQGISRTHLTADTRAEIEHWRFVDDKLNPVPWRDERHSFIEISSDASGFRWGAVLHNAQQMEPTANLGDYFKEQDRQKDINCKEAKAVALTLLSAKRWVRDSRVVMNVDNKAVVDAWQGHGAKSVALNQEIKHIFETTLKLNVALSLTHVSTHDNQADYPSRILSKSDCMLAPHLWRRLQAEFGGRTGHTVDLMALDSNAQRDRSGAMLKHYTPYPTPESAGVDMFRFDPSTSSQGGVENAYVFPPINMISAVVNFVTQHRANTTIVVPKLSPIPTWWPTLMNTATRAIKISEAGSKSALLFPTKAGFQTGKVFRCEALVTPPTFPVTPTQPLPTIPRQWTPSVACPECHHPNDHNFRQCQMCAYQRKPFKHPQKAFHVDEIKIEERLNEVKNIASTSEYGKKKVAIELELTDFLGNISPPKDLITASPKNVCAFLVWKDKGGKTVVHTTGCKNFGNKRKTDCSCPRRLAAGTVDSIIGQLRSIFNSKGRGGEWNDTICTGNPAAAPMVKQYLKVMREEQANALVQPTQAQPVFFSKLERVCRHITSKMKNPTVKETSLFALARDQAFFKILFFAADRASDLGRCKAEELAWLPGEAGIRFNHTFGKTLRDGSANAFPILAGKNNSTCPVQGLRVYIRVAQALKIRLNKGYLFRTMDKSHRVMNEPFLYDAAQSRFKMYLSEMGEYEGDTLHGVRTASAITMALGGADSSSLMTHVGWRNKSTAERYLRLDRVYHEKSPAAILQEEVTRSSAKANSTTQANAVRDRLDPEAFYEGRNRGHLELRGRGNPGGVSAETPAFSAHILTLTESKVTRDLVLSQVALRVGRCEMIPTCQSHHQHHHGDEEARDEKRKRLMEYYRGGPTSSNHQEPARKEKSPGSEEDELVREMFSNQPPSKRLSSTFKTKSLSDSDSSPDQENVFMNGPIPAFRERDHHRPPLDRVPTVSHHRGVIPEERPLHQDWEQRQQRPMLSRDRSLSSPELDKASAFERMLRGRSISVEEVLSSDDPADFDAGREFGRTEADSHMLLHTPSKVCGVVTHDQYLFLLRLQESIAQLQDCMEEDAVAIRGRPSNVSSSCIAACCRQVELSLILPSPPVGSRASGSAAGSTADVGAASQQRRSSLQTDTLMVPGATTPRTTSPSPVDSGIAESTTAGNGNHVAKSQSDTALMSLSSDEENNGGENRKRRNLSSGERPKSFTEDGVTTLRKSPSRDGPDSGRGSGNVAESANERQENVRTDQSQQDRGLMGAMPTKQVPKLTVSDGTKEIAKDSPLFEKKFGKFSDFSAANIAAQLRIGLLSQSQLSLDEMSLDNFSLDNMSLDSTDSGDPYLMAGTEMSTLSGSRSAPVSHQSSFERTADGEPTRQASLEDGRDGRPTVLAGDGEGSTRPKKVTLEYCDSESSTEEVSQSAGSATTIEETKKRKTATVLVLHLSDVGLELSNHQRDNFTKLQGQEISFEERREVDVQDFLAKISQRKRHRRHFKFRTMFPTEDSPSRRRRVKKDVPLPSATDVPPHVSARLESGPHAARYSPNAPKLGHLELQLQGAAGVVTMSTLTGVASLIEDEILTTPMPMRVDFADSQLSLVDDGPPLNPGSPGSIPLDIHVDRATVVRMEDGIFHLTCVSPSPHLGVAVPGRMADHLLPGLQAGGHSSAAAAQAGGHSSAAAAQVTALKEENDRLQREVARLREQQKSSMTSQLLSENLCLQGEKQQLKEELLDTQHALQEAEQERTTLLRTLEHVQEEMLQADREKNFLRDQLDRRSPRK